jgi:hypothetical protein
MELAVALREALELHVLEDDSLQAVRLLRDASNSFGAAEVAEGLLDTAAIALRRMVAELDDHLELDEVIDRLTLQGSVPKDSANILAMMLTHAAATAGGLRPRVQSAVELIGEERVLANAWLATVAVVLEVALNLERTQAEIVDEMVRALEHF